MQRFLIKCGINGTGYFSIASEWVTCSFGERTVASGVPELAVCRAGAGPERS